MAWSDAARQAAIAARQAHGSATADAVGQARSAIKGALAIAPQTNQDAAGALANGHPKSGLVGIHSASAISRGITRMRLAFHNSDG